MNEHIEELIIAYLHRGTTPEQERELFEACRTQPETAEYLRQHLIMSLKLRQLRDTTEVPLEARNAVIQRINEIQSAAEQQSAPKRIASIFGARPAKTPLFGWRHVFGTGVAAVALSTVFLTFVTNPFGAQRSTSETAMVNVHDTISVVKTDTVFQVRELRKPVYITRTVEVPAAQKAVEIVPDGRDFTENVQPPKTEPEIKKEVQNPAPPAITDSASPGIAESAAPFQEQYKAMLSTLKRVQISSNDRIRN